MSEGALALAFERRGERTVLARCRYSVPLQVLAPVALDDPAAIVSMLNPTGGLLGGDRLTIDVGVGAGAHACLTTPSATKVYRTDAAPAVQEVRMRVARGAVAEWMPDHTIPFPGSALRQSLDVELDDEASLIALDAFAAGRVARGESWRFRLLDSALRLRDAAGWLLHDRVVLRGDATGARVPWSGLACAESACYFATVVVIDGAAPAELAAALRPVAERCRDAVAAVGELARRGVVVRCLADSAPALTDAIAAIWTAARALVVGAPPPALRKG